MRIFKVYGKEIIETFGSQNIKKIEDKHHVVKLFLSII